jgi:hypothetical protein
VGVYKFSAPGTLKTGRTLYTSMLAGNPVFVPGVYDSIATTTVDAGGASSVTFSSIPSTYTHLQVRILAQTNRTTFGRDGFNMRINSDSGANYSSHFLTGDGASAGAAAVTSGTAITTPEVTTSTAGANIFGAFIVDILDYANTTKNTTARLLGGGDHNGVVNGLGAQVSLRSGAWYSTSAVTSLTFTPSVGTTISQYSSFALYGIKGA